MVDFGLVELISMHYYSVMYRYVVMLVVQQSSVTRLLELDYKI